MNVRYIEIEDFTYLKLVPETQIEADFMRLQMGIDPSNEYGGSADLFMEENGTLLICVECVSINQPPKKDD